MKSVHTVRDSVVEAAVKAVSSVKDKIDNNSVPFSGVSIVKNVEFVLETHTHKKYLRKIVDLVKAGTFIRDGNDLCRLCGLSHETVGGDFKSVDLPGDMKFLTEGSKVCLGGRVDIKTIYEQGKMLVIVYHPKKDKNVAVYAGYLDIWSIKGTKDEAFDLVNKWKAWNEGGRKNFLETSFVSENFFIDTHEKDDDRFYVKSSFVQSHIEYFVKNDEYVQKSGVEAQISRFHSYVNVSKVTKEPKKVEIIKMKISELISGLQNNEFFVPDYQRDLQLNAEFLEKYIVTTVLAGEAENRGIYMFHAQKNGTKAVVDGQQRLYNAIKGFFLGNHRLKATGMYVPFLGDVKDVSNLTWSDLLAMAKKDVGVRAFVKTVLDYQVTCKVYSGYTYQEMATEYHIANDVSQLNRQELRTSYDSWLGNLVRHCTTPRLRKPEFSKAGVMLFDDIFCLGPASKGTFKDVNISVDRFNGDSLLAFTFHSCSTWGEGYIENENIIDAEYERYKDVNDTVKAWKPTEDFLSILSNIMKVYNSSAWDGNRYNTYGNRGDRIHRAQGYTIAKQEEWDLIMFLVLELKRRHAGKKLVVIGDVWSKILKHHYAHVVSKNPLEYESYYGRCVRKEQRTWKQINEVWFPVWEDVLLSLSEPALEKFGFKFV
jgi:hypothetical protein